MSDADLIAQIARQDQRALSQLYNRYARIVQAMAYKTLRSVEESEEVVLEVFSQIWRIADRYDPAKSRPDSWIFMLARSRTLDRLRKLARNSASEIVAIDGTEIQLASSDVNPIESAILSEQRQRVVAVMATIPAEQRLVIELAYFQGLSQSQIAVETGLSLGTVKTRIRLGLNKLKGCLKSDSKGLDLFGNW
jgi:RNA polymerase sigma-70 factor, ECF subfamily